MSGGGAPDRELTPVAVGAARAGAGDGIPAALLGIPQLWPASGVSIGVADALAFPAVGSCGGRRTGLPTSSELPAVAKTPALERDDDSVCNALVPRFLHGRVSGLAGQGLVIAGGMEPDWTEALSASGEGEVVSMGRCAGRDVARSTDVEWVVLDRCLQRLPESANVLDAAVRRLKPGAGLVTLLTGIARAGKSERAPLWNATPCAALRLHEGHNGHNELKHVEVEQYGNVTLALACLYRLPACALTERELAAVDPAYPLLVAGTATRRGRRI